MDEAQFELAGAFKAACADLAAIQALLGLEGVYAGVDPLLRAITELGLKPRQAPVSAIRQRALGLYQPPFRFECGYILAANGQMVADQHDGPDSLRVRGWGRISYMDNPEKLQDEVGALIAEALTEKWLSAAQPPLQANGGVAE